MLKQHKIKAFTLIEIMVVVVIVAILASIGIPKYIKTVDEANIRNIRTQLITLHAANEIYRAQDGDEYLAGSGLTLDETNDGLNINIILPTSGVTFTYTRSDLLEYTATSTYTGSKVYTISVAQNPISASNPSCSPGACP